MKCREVEKYIYLSKEETLGKKIKQELDEHLNTCKKCADEFAKSQEYFSLVADLQNIKPELENPPAISENIIEQIESIKHTSTGFNINSILDLVYLPAVRYAAAILLLGIGIFYFAEEIYTVQNISELEKSYAGYSEHQFNKTESAAVEPGIFNSAKDMYNILSGDKNSLDLPGGWILVKKSELLELLKDYNRYAGLSVSNIKEDARLKRLLSDEDYKMLMNKRNEIRKLINRFLPGGEK